MPLVIGEAERVRGIGNATVLLREATDGLPEATRIRRLAYSGIT